MLMLKKVQEVPEMQEETKVMVQKLKAEKYLSTHLRFSFFKLTDLISIIIFQGQKYKTNQISTAKYNLFTFIPKFLFEQFRRYFLRKIMC